MPPCSLLDGSPLVSDSLDPSPLWSAVVAQDAGCRRAVLELRLPGDRALIGWVR